MTKNSENAARFKIHKLHIPVHLLVLLAAEDQLAEGQL